MIAWMFLAASAWAQQPAGASLAGYPTSLEDLSADLRSATAGRRGYAARELRRRARRVARTLGAERADPERTFEARVDKADLRGVALPAALGALTEHRDIVRPCLAIILAIGGPEDVPALRAAWPEVHPRGQPRVEEAIRALGGSL